jgi:hypothetical protein
MDSPAGSVGYPHTPATSASSRKLSVSKVLADLQNSEIGVTALVDTLSTLRRLLCKTDFYNRSGALRLLVRRAHRATILWCIHRL